jgi:hypothetical protein
MKPLTIELANGAKRQLQSIGWKTAKENDCRRHFYALTQDGKPFVITPKVAMPDFYDPSRQARAVFSCEPFPEAVCVEISPCRLLPPPCYQSREAFEGQRDMHPFFDPWRAIYERAHNVVLLLEPADDGPLQERLNKWLAAMRAAYEQETAAWRKKIELVTNSRLHELGYETEEQRAKRLVELQAQLDMVESENPIDGMPCKGRLKLTLADVKLGCEGIRDAWMQEDWARKSGEDLGLMARERRKFRGWLESHTGTPANIIDATVRPSRMRQGIAPPDFGERFESNPQFLEACAQVRYRAQFADNANTVVYLADCELREELTAVEIVEAKQLTTPPSPATPMPWHSEGFATIRRLNQRGELIETLPLPNEFRALCQLLAERPDQTGQFSEIEPHIGTRTCELDTAAKVANPALKGERRIRDLFRTEIGRRLQEWGVLVEIEIGREKFLKLNPPKPA